MKLFRKSKSCPLVENFGGELRVKLNTRKGQKNAEDRGLCMMLDVSCCTEGTFVSYRDTWNQAVIMLKIYIEFMKHSKAFFLKDFFSYGIAKTPINAKACQHKAMANCVAKFKNLTKAVETAKVGLAKFQQNIDKCYNKLNAQRAKFLCVSCDVVAGKYMNYEEKSITVGNYEFDEVVDACWEWVDYEVNEMKPVYTAYFEYATLVKPGADLDIGAVTNNIRLGEKVVVGCSKF